jgi:hypothetical protein
MIGPSPVLYACICVRNNDYSPGACEAYLTNGDGLQAGSGVHYVTRISWPGGPGARPKKLSVRTTQNGNLRTNVEHRALVVADSEETWQTVKAHIGNQRMHRATGTFF